MGMMLLIPMLFHHPRRIPNSPSHDMCKTFCHKFSDRLHRHKFFTSDSLHFARRNYYLMWHEEADCCEAEVTEMCRQEAIKVKATVATVNDSKYCFNFRLSRRSSTAFYIFQLILSKHWNICAIEFYWLNFVLCANKLIVKYYFKFTVFW